MTSARDRHGQPPAHVAACPGCGKPARLDPGNVWRPFCSERCKLIDLGAWFSGERSIAVDEPACRPEPES